MRIPLPKMLRHWREKEFEKHLNPATQRFGLKAWTFVAKRPRLYRFVTRIAASLMRTKAGGKGRLSSLPLAKGWTAHRDLAAPEGPGFLQQWQAKGRR